MKKTIFTLNIGNYYPEITKITYPFIKLYSDKIGANFELIDKRAFPNFPVRYEKLQIYELGKDNDWNIFIDSDCLIHPDLFDITEVLPVDTVMTYNMGFANIGFSYDNFFRRDGRNISVGNFFAVTSSYCHDYWLPLDDITIDEAFKYIHAAYEGGTAHDSKYIIDDYVTSRNIARFGLKFKTFLNYLAEIGRSNDEYFYHNHYLPYEEKLRSLNETLKQWKL